MSGPLYDRNFSRSWQAQCFVINDQSKKRPVRVLDIDQSESRRIVQVDRLILRRKEVEYETHLRKGIKDAYLHPH